MYDDWSLTWQAISRDDLKGKTHANDPTIGCQVLDALDDTHAVPRHRQ
jgi:hypothetical protein